MAAQGGSVGGTAGGWAVDGRRLGGGRAVDEFTLCYALAFHIPASKQHLIGKNRIMALQERDSAFTEGSEAAPRRTHSDFPRHLGLDHADTAQEIGGRPIFDTAALEQHAQCAAGIGFPLGLKFVLGPLMCCAPSLSCDPSQGREAMPMLKDIPVGKRTRQ